ncbi:MAG: molybdenum cofactor guanylyltransferase, partial [Actinomycetota bacterium]|nr:molybdenum cofactor guanylyltransferase [Actinomycetota bacterium]
MTGLVLAGGDSTRMGRDKALLRLGGRTLVERAVAVLADCCDPVLVASGDGRRLPGPGVEQVADRSGAGPLAGILGGLERSPHPLVAVVAVDMPYASAAVLRALAAQWRGEPAVVPSVAGRLEPLHAVWH